MVYAAWDARIATPDEHGSTPLASLRALLRRGRVDVLPMLDGPPFPEGMRYMWTWFREIRRGIGEGMNGAAPLNWTTLDAWARRTRHDPAPHECEALFSLDTVTRHPELMDEDGG